MVGSFIYKISCMEIIPIKTRLFCVNESLLSFINEHISFLDDNDVVLITSKIVALSQGRVSANLTKKDELIESEADAVVSTPWCKMARLKGRWTANAGIDESNGNGNLILFPAELDQTAMNLRQELLKTHKIKNIGVIITDSRSIPLRAGVMSTSVGSAGIKLLRSYIGQPDLVNKKMEYTRLNVADSLSAAAGLLMGEGNEAIPLVVVRGSPVEFITEVTDSELLNISPEDDLYRNVYIYTEKKH